MKGHTTARIGKRVHVVLYTGRHFIDKLTDDKSRYFMFEKEGKIPKRDIRSFSIARNQNVET